MILYFSFLFVFFPWGQSPEPDGSAQTVLVEQIQSDQRFLGKTVIVAGVLGYPITGGRLLYDCRGGGEMRVLKIDLREGPDFHRVFVQGRVTSSGRVFTLVECRLIGSENVPSSPPPASKANPGRVLTNRDFGGGTTPAARTLNDTDSSPSVFSGPPGSFRITIPTGLPTPVSVTNKPKAELTGPQYVSATPTEFVMLSFIDKPEKKYSKAVPADLDEALAGFLSATKATEVKKEATTFRKFPARTVTSAFLVEGIRFYSKALVFLVGNRVYLFNYASRSPEMRQSPRATAFFDSIEFQ